MVFCCCQHWQDIVILLMPTAFNTGKTMTNLKLEFLQLLSSFKTGKTLSDMVFCYFQLHFTLANNI